MKKILALLICLMFPAVVWGAQASQPYTLTNGTTADGSETNSDFSEIYSKYNDHDTSATAIHNVGAGSVVGTTLSQTLTNKVLDVATTTMSSTAGIGFVPQSGIIMWAGTIATIPAGWHLCDGGTGHGITIPDLTNKFIVCANADSGGAAKSTITGSAAQSGGSTTIAANNLPEHTHAVGTLAAANESTHTHTGTTDNGGVAHTHGISHTANASGGGGAYTTGGFAYSAPYGDGTSGAASATNHTHTFTSGAGAAHTHSLSGSTAVNSTTAAAYTQPFYALAYIIKL